MHFSVEGEGTFASLEFQPYGSRILQLFDLRFVVVVVVVVVVVEAPPISPRLTEAEKERDAYFPPSRAKE